MQSGFGWLGFATMTFCAWGLYGAFIHTGSMAMQDSMNGRYKAFLFIGVAYFLTAILAPMAMLYLNKAEWKFPAPAVRWSLAAGIMGAIGAFGVLLSLGAGGKPIFVMSVIFAGAPVVNALYAMIVHPPEGGWGTVKPQFWLGILLAASGGALVSYYKPAPGPAPKHAAAEAVLPAEPKPDAP